MFILACWRRRHTLHLPSLLLFSNTETEDMIMLQLDVYKTVKFVCDELGRTLTAALSGTRNRLDVDAWMKVGRGHATPTDHQLSRLRFAKEMFEKVSNAEDADTARAWFIGANVGDDEISPIEAIRNGRFDEVRTSATRMIED